VKFHRYFAVLLLLLSVAHGNAQDVAQSVVAGIDAYNRGDVATAYRLLWPPPMRAIRMPR
jgi:hypothetical protein